MTDDRPRIADDDDAPRVNPAGRWVRPSPFVAVDMEKVRALRVHKDRGEGASKTDPRWQYAVVADFPEGSQVVDGPYETEQQARDALATLLKVVDGVDASSYRVEDEGG